MLLVFARKIVTRRSLCHQLSLLLSLPFHSLLPASCVRPALADATCNADVQCASAVESANCLLCRPRLCLCGREDRLNQGASHAVPQVPFSSLSLTHTEILLQRQHTRNSVKTTELTLFCKRISEGNGKEKRGDKTGKSRGKGGKRSMLT